MFSGRREVFSAAFEPVFLFIPLDVDYLMRKEKIIFSLHFMLKYGILSTVVIKGSSWHFSSSGLKCINGVSPAERPAVTLKCETFVAALLGQRKSFVLKNSLRRSQNGVS